MHVRLAILSTLLTSLSVSAQSPPAFPPPVPTTESEWPEWDESVPVRDKFIQTPFIQESIAWVKAKVPAEILAIKPSTYIPATPNAPKYNDDRAKNHYLVYGQDDFIKCPQPDTWGLTYDDGPQIGVTPKVRAALKENGLKATFFVKGDQAKGYAAELKATFDEGHEIAMHTWTHRK